jgi:hypothetical protein
MLYTYFKYENNVPYKGILYFSLIYHIFKYIWYLFVLKIIISVFHIVFVSFCYIFVICI